MAKLNKINLNGVSYDIEDANAQSQLGTLTGDLSQEVSNRQSAVQGVQDNLDNEVRRAKADASNVYTKSQVDSMVGNKVRAEVSNNTLNLTIQ